MKVAILHPFLFRYRRGIERFSWELAAHLAQRNVQVDILTWQHRNQVNWGPVPGGVRVRRVPDLRYYMGWVAVPYYVRWLAAECYDWVILYFADYGEARAIQVARAFRPQRYCIVFQFPRDVVPHRYSGFGKLDLAQNADLLVAVSEYVARGTRAAFGRECMVIGNGVDPDVFRPSAETRHLIRRRLGLSDKAPIIITLAALEERKGIQWVIRALPRLLKDFRELHYLVLGEGPYQAELQREVDRHGLTGHVSLLGAVGDVVSHLAGADIACLLSYGEAFPLALIEYMAMELPVLTSRKPPFDELVRPEWGRVVEETDPNAVASALRELLEDAARRQALGCAGRRQILENYTWDRIADRYLALFTHAG